MARTASGGSATHAAMNARAAAGSMDCARHLNASTAQNPPARQSGDIVGGGPGLPASPERNRRRIDFSASAAMSPQRHQGQAGAGLNPASRNDIAMAGEKHTPGDRPGMAPLANASVAVKRLWCHRDARDGSSPPWKPRAPIPLRQPGLPSGEPPTEVDVEALGQPLPHLSRVDTVPGPQVVDDRVGLAVDVCGRPGGLAHIVGVWLISGRGRGRPDPRARPRNQ